jgi:hypothetical protein
MQSSFPRILSIACSVLMLSGCATSVNSLFSSHPERMKLHKQKIQSAQKITEAHYLIQDLESSNAILSAQELGRLAQLEGDFQQSIRYYKQAIQAYDEDDLKAVVSASEVATLAGSLIINDKLMAYRGLGFERITLHQYQSLNYLMLGNYQAAMVETRRANELQRIEQKRYEDEHGQAVLEPRFQSQQLKTLNTLSGQLENSFFNAYNYFTTGFLHELSGNDNDALIDYQKAHVLAPNNQGLKQYIDSQKKTTNPSNGRLVLIYEQDFVAPKQTINILLPIGQQIQSVAIPTYNKYNLSKKEPKLIGLQNKTCQNLVDFNQIAVKALAEQYPTLILRQVARLTAKHQVGSQFGVLGQLTNILTEQADLRSWLTLPSHVCSVQSVLPKNHYHIKIDGHPITFNIKPRGHTFIWVRKTGHIIKHDIKVFTQI